MPLHPDAVGSVHPPVERSWTSADSLLYSVAVGAGQQDPLAELSYTTENSADAEQRVLPTYAVVLGTPARSAFRAAGSYNPAKVLHAGQSITLHRPIPVAGTLRAVSTVTAVEDRGSGGLVTVSTESVEAATGEPLFTNTMSIFIRGEGGFGGEKARSVRHAAPDREPDHHISCPTSPGQALLYRLCGDRNPLHSDPAFAAAGGFGRPILHGLCTYGFTGRALLAALCHGDAAKFEHMEARFSKPVLPGDTLTVSVWLDDDGSAATFHTTTADGTVVISDGRVRVRH